MLKAGGPSPRWCVSDESNPLTVNSIPLANEWFRNVHDLLLVTEMEDTFCWGASGKDFPAPQNGGWPRSLLPNLLSAFELGCVKTWCLEWLWPAHDLQWKRSWHTGWQSRQETGPESWGCGWASGSTLLLPTSRLLRRENGEPSLFNI